MLDILTARQLLQMGYAPEEIAALDKENPQPIPDPAPEPKPDPQPAPVPDQTQVLQMVQQLTGNVDKLQKQIQALAIRDIVTPDRPKQATAEEILSQMLQPYKDIKGKGDNK